MHRLGRELSAWFPRAQERLKQSKLLDHCGWKPAEHTILLRAMSSGPWMHLIYGSWIRRPTVPKDYRIIEFLAFAGVCYKIYIMLQRSTLFQSLPSSLKPHSSSRCSSILNMYWRHCKSRDCTFMFLSKHLQQHNPDSSQSKVESWGLGLVSSPEAHCQIQKPIFMWYCQSTNLKGYALSYNRSQWEAQ